ncbi:hypothetical protein UNDKW_1116 [Undibacterium sp. KW1]|uniref:Pepco domain-containing protein n=1 Tax=Undibacterium sp. KW1 TaxID=2058624 RepID=UPI001331F843|nr:hypothetical protein [Undibacterium sp. KW1]BBB59389.1 hypothetical protein UNDKW_1116 [Undibacterium sp. KW1]
MTKPDNHAVFDGIPIIYEEQSNYEGAKGLHDSLDQIARKVDILDISHLKTRLTTVCSQLGDVLQSIEMPSSSYRLDSFEVTVDVTAKGEVRLVGSVGAEVKGGIKLVFKKNS